MTRVALIKRLVLWSILFTLLSTASLLQNFASAQAGFDDNRVMLQGFYWV